jgi:hypothetical protein
MLHLDDPLGATSVRAPHADSACYYLLYARLQVSSARSQRGVLEVIIAPLLEEPMVQEQVTLPLACFSLA